MAGSVTNQKSLLMRAWRERWTEARWSIAAKRFITNAASANQLADLLMSHTFQASSPNTIWLEYVKHAVSSQMITTSSVIAYIVKYESTERLKCTIALLNLVESLTKKVSIAGNNEDSLQVARSLLSLIHWLLNLTKLCHGKIKDDKSAVEHRSLVEKVTSILHLFLSNQDSLGLLHVAHIEDEGTYEKLKMLHSRLTSSMIEFSACLSAESAKKLREGLDIVHKMANLDIPMQPIVDASRQSLNASLNVLLNIEAINKSTNDIAPFVEQILIIEAMQGLERPTLYCELLRTSLAGMVDSSGGPEELRWAAFTFLKIPQVLMQLTKREPKNEEGEVNSLLLQGFNMLLNYVALIDLTDMKSGADCMQYILNEVHAKHSLLTDAQCEMLSKKRELDSKKPAKSGEQQNQSQPSAILILRAEYTVTSVLKTLDADYSKNQEALLGVLCHMMSGKSFELILAAAAATGKLQSLAIKLIKFNEFSKQTSGEAGKGAQTRLLLFDISFLMLCHFTQLYGTEIVCSHPDSQSSFFLQYATRCLPEGGKYKSPDLFTPADPAKVDSLLNQFNPGGELKINMARWQDVCQQAPHAMQQVLNAWEYGALKEAQLKTIIDNVKNRLCCLPVVISTYLCSHINTLDSAHRAKPLSFLAQLRQTTTPQSGQSPAAGSNSSSDGGTGSGSQNDYYSERSNLMSVIVSKVVQAVLPEGERQAEDFEMNPSSDPALNALSDTFNNVFQRGSIDIKSTQKFEYLLNLTGPTWFSYNLVMSVLHKDRPEDLNRALGITLALFNTDLEALVLSLVLHVIPGLLLATGSRTCLLTDPKGKALAQLTVMALALLHKHKETSKAAATDFPAAFAALKRGRKRTLSQVSFEEDLGDAERPTKLRKQLSEDNADAEDPFSFNADFNFPRPTTAQEESPEKGSNGPDLKEPVNKALWKLFKVMSAIVSSDEVNQRSGFVASFIQEVLKSGKENIRWILQFMPLSMIGHIIKTISNECTAPVLLALCDLSAPQGRRAATKVISQNAKMQLIRSSYSKSKTARKGPNFTLSLPTA